MKTFIQAVSFIAIFAWLLSPIVVAIVESLHVNSSVEKKTMDSFNYHIVARTDSTPTDAYIMSE